MLCMFTPKETALERGWPGKIDGDRVIQLAAQTLQAFFTGGGGAREHAEYAVDDVLLRAPVLHPPSVRIFAPSGDFVFANPAAIHGPGDVVRVPEGATGIVPVARLAAIIGAEGAIGGYTLMNDWHAPELEGVKVFDFATSLGPVVLTPDEYHPADIDFAALIAHAGRNTRLLPGEVIAAPGGTRLDPVHAGDVAEVSLPPFWPLRNPIA
jgi:2-keto-4-pentenoate hydratase/2-oxohepta-3-ene-1,7-dioic acid hydratase in catechol pathway